MTRFYSYFLTRLTGLLLIALAVSSPVAPAHAQNAPAVAVDSVDTVPLAAQAEYPAKGERLSVAVRPAGPASLLAEQGVVHLWGLEKPLYMPPAMRARAVSALQNVIGSNQVVCEVASSGREMLSAQCVNTEGTNIGLHMISQGLASVDRALVLGSRFEAPYLEAEQNAQNAGLGVWSSAGNSAEEQDGGFMLTLGFMLFVAIVSAFIVLSLIIMRGFQRVIDAQNRNMDMMSKERRLRDKERAIIAMILDSELKANKSKIEAYLVVYEEMLRSMQDPERTPKYKSVGDIVQKQPILDRVVFDRNTDKIDILGRDLASALVHFYARVKSNPEYSNLEPDMSLEEATGIVSDALEGARRLNELAEELLKHFEESGFTIDQEEIDRSFSESKSESKKD